jgi:type IV secretory pathway TrbL component
MDEKKLNSDFKKVVDKVQTNSIYNKMNEFVEYYIPNYFLRILFWIALVIIIFIVTPLTIVTKLIEYIISGIFLIIFIILNWIWVNIIYPILLIIIS